MYLVSFNGTELELPNYNFTIAAKIEEIEANNKKSSSMKFKEKCRKMYNFEVELLGKDKMKNIIGEFDTCDPNDINILYLGIVNCYNQPISQYTQEQTDAQLNDSNLSKVIELVNAMDKVASNDLIRATK